MNKKKTYILLATVLAIWGTIGYKIINGINPDVEEDKEQSVNVAFNKPKHTAVDTFSIKQVTRDPFLGTLERKNTVPKKRSSKKTATKSSKKLENYTITYGGLIKKQASKQQVFVLNINSQQYLLKKGQTADSIKLINADSKQAVVQYKNERQTIPIK